MTKFKLKKTKVPMRSSEFEIYNYINQFEVKCSSTYCKDCNIVRIRDKEDIESMDINKCMARYIYERIIKID